MEKYESLGVVGEGSYGVVIKSRHRESGQIVAIKKFLETEDDASVRKMALREVRMLKRLRHENLVNMLEVFRRKKRFYIVFEFMDRTILDELEAMGGRGIPEHKCREYIFQVVRGVDFCHTNSVIHRDIKPENVLVSNSGVVKLCDFGFARQVTGAGDVYTEYVATRWYRAPELLVPDPHYGKPVDIWAIGCLFAEIMAGDPLFPGDSDIDQLFLIMKVMGRLSQRHQHLLLRNPVYRGLKKTEEGATNLQAKFPAWTLSSLDFLGSCLKMDPLLRPNSGDLLRHLYLTKDDFQDKFLPILRYKIQQETENNPLLRKLQSSALKRTKEKTESCQDNFRKSFHVDSRRTSIELNRYINPSWNRPEPMDTSTDDVENRREMRGWDQATPLSPLLQLTTTQIHPTVSNLCFSSEGAPKPSPQPQPLVSKVQVTRNQLVRKLDRPVNNILLGNRDREPNTSSPPAWLATKKTPAPQSWKISRNHSRGGLDDDFSLPNLPGITASPKKHNKKKSNFVWKEEGQTPTPRHQTSQPPSAASRTKHSGLPFM